MGTWMSKLCMQPCELVSQQVESTSWQCYVPLPELTGSLRCLILRFLYPNLGRGRLAYHELQTSEGGVTSRTGHVARAMCKDSEPPRGYVCGSCRQAGHWRQFCPRGHA